MLLCVALPIVLADDYWVKHKCFRDLGLTSCECLQPEWFDWLCFALLFVLAEEVTCAIAKLGARLVLGMVAGGAGQGLMYAAILHLSMRCVVDCITSASRCELHD